MSIRSQRTELSVILLVLGSLDGACGVLLCIQNQKKMRTAFWFAFSFTLHSSRLSELCTLYSQPHAVGAIRADFHGFAPLGGAEMDGNGSFFPVPRSWSARATQDELGIE